MKPRNETLVTLKATGKHDNLITKYQKEFRFNMLDPAEREAFFLAIEDYVLEIASQERKAE